MTKKQFSDFEAYLSTLDIQAMQDSIVDELNEREKQMNMSETEALIWRSRSFNAKFTMRMLKEYHNWLNK